MKSHEYAKQIKATAERMLASPEVELDTGPYLFINFYDKERFMSAVRAFGSGDKKYSECDFRYSPHGTCMTMTIARNKVCRKIQEEKWECEPILSEQEVEAL